MELIITAIPCLNEEKTIASVIIKAQRHVDKVIVCDDGSKDMTSIIAERLGADVIKHRKNKGKGVAMRSIFERARELGADVLVTLDGDGQHDPDEIPTLLSALKAKGDVDVVVGSRFLEKNGSVPRFRALGNSILNRMTDDVLTDTQSGFRAYTKRAIKSLIPAEMGIGVDSELIIKGKQLGLNIVEVPVSVRYDVPKSSKKNFLVHALDVGGVAIKFVSIRHPLLFYGSSGLAILIAGIGFGLWAFDFFNRTNVMPTNLVLIAATLTLTGLLTIFTGIILFTLETVVRERQ